MQSGVKRILTHGLFVAAVLLFLQTKAGARIVSDCDVIWSSIDGYSIVCDSWPHEPTCPDDWTLESDCDQWCSQWQNNIMQDWGCSEEVPWSYEMWCACWLTT